MKSKLIICILFLLNFSKLFAENINIEAKNISIDKNQETTIFENEVKVTTEDNVVIESDYAKYNKKLNFLILKNNVKAIDKEGNKIKLILLSIMIYLRFLKQPVQLKFKHHSHIL